MCSASRRLVRSVLFLVGATLAGVAAAPQAPAPPPVAAGTLEVTFLYLPPTDIDPTYHTAIWLDNEQGQLVKTLFVSNELSGTEYKMGNACPDWVKQAHWGKAAQAQIDAVTGPTPNVGNGALSFDLGALGVEPGTYQFHFEMHIIDQYNVQYTGKLVVGADPQTVKLEVLYSPEKRPGGSDYVRDVEARYRPASRPQ